MTFRLDGRVVMQRPAKPFTPVRFRLQPPILLKNILILLPSLGQGGAEKIHIDLANSWSDIYKVTLVTLFNDQALRDNLNERINFKCLNTKSILGHCCQS